MTHSIFDAGFAPMLAATARNDQDLQALLDLAKSQAGTLLISPKIDGFRVCLDIENDLALSRKGKPLRNSLVSKGLQGLAATIRTQRQNKDLQGKIAQVAERVVLLDGEVVLCREGRPLPFTEVSSAVTGEGNAPWDDDPSIEIHFIVFDALLRPENSPATEGPDPSVPYVERLATVMAMLQPEQHAAWFVGAGRSMIHPFRAWELDRENKTTQLPTVSAVPTRIVESVEEIRSLHDQYVADGWEGAMLRFAGSPYKYNRATLREGGLTKLKIYSDSEARILEIHPRMHNTNEATKDATGRTKRSSAKQGKVPMPQMGTMLVEDVHTGVQFNVGSGEGMTDDLRTVIWNARDEFLGLVIKYKFFGIGHEDGGLPRHPLFLCFVDESDVDTSS